MFFQKSLLLWAVVLCALFSSCQRAHGALSEFKQLKNLIKTNPSLSSPKINNEGGQLLFKKNDLMIDEVSRIFKALATASKLPGSLITSLYGLALVFYGGNFPEQVLIISMARVTGWVRFVDLLKNIAQNFEKARNVAKQESPNLIEAKHLCQCFITEARQLRKIKKKIQEAKKDNIISDSEYDEIYLMTDNTTKQIEANISKLAGTLSSFQAILSNFNFSGLLTLLEAAAFMLASVAAMGSSSETIANLACLFCIVIHTGSVVNYIASQFKYPFSSNWIFASSYESLPPQLRSLVKGTSILVTHIVVLMIYIKSKAFVFKMNSALLGAYFTAEGISGVVSSGLTKKSTTLRSNKIYSVLIGILVSLLGVFGTLFPLSFSVDEEGNNIIPASLYPLTILEKLATLISNVAADI